VNIGGYAVLNGIIVLIVGFLDLYRYGTFLWQESKQREIQYKYLVISISMAMSLFVFGLVFYIFKVNSFVQDTIVISLGFSILITINKFHSTNFGKDSDIFA